MKTAQRAEYGGPDGQVTDRVLSTLAEATGSDPTEFDRPLYEVVDPDALDALFQHDGTETTVEFVYLGHEVRVSGDGAVSVTDLDV